MKQLSASRQQIITVLAHIAGWGIVFGFPFLMMSRSSGFELTWMDYLRRGSVVPMSFLIVFYANYCFLIPRCLFKGHIRRYLLLNLLLIACTATGIHFWQELMFHYFAEGNPGDRHKGPPKWIFIIRDVFSMILTVGLSAAIRLSGRWMQAENARREAEKDRTEAELKNLRNQLNPHFLLNTLNNIYALIAFDSDKAQQAVQELSKLLRYVLYDNQQTYVPLCKEVDFIRNYIGLMRIRLTGNVKVTTRFDIEPDSRTDIAPLIFISLIENAFKHGISPTEPSYIHIHLYENDQEIGCEIRNSYHPKTEKDKSGSGIGLEQVAKRLELTYAGRYDWKKAISADGKEYASVLNIYKTGYPKLNT